MKVSVRREGRGRPKVLCGGSFAGGVSAKNIKTRFIVFLAKWRSVFFIRCTGDERPRRH